MTVQKETRTRYQLNTRQLKFANEYIKTGNAYRSAINAGYSEPYAKTDSHKMLKKKNIRAYIEERNKRVNKKVLEEQIDVHRSLNKVIQDAQTIDIFNQFIHEEVVEEFEDNKKRTVKRKNVAVNPRVLIQALELKAKLDGLLNQVDQDSIDYEVVQIENDIE